MTSKRQKEAPRTKQTDSTTTALPHSFQSKESLWGYQETVDDLVSLLAAARSSAVRSINAIMTSTYWLVGKRIVEQEQKGQERAQYGEELLERLAQDLSQQFGRGFSRRNLTQMRKFYSLWAAPYALASGKDNFSLPLSAAAIWQTVSAKSGSVDFSSVPRFPLPWSHYVRLLSVQSQGGRAFYEEALRGGWTLRQLDRQIGSQFYERTALSKDKAAMLRKGAIARPDDVVALEEQVKDPLLFEFLDLQDQYSEGNLEDALIANLENFLLELGSGFTFVGRQRRLRIGDEWYKVDLLLFHRRLRCLVIIDLKLTKFTHADMGQMHVYVNYAKEHWMMEGENPPIGLILCSEKKEDLARYAFEGLSSKIAAAEYKTFLPSEEALTQELQRIRRQLETRAMAYDNGEAPSKPSTMNKK